MAPAALRKHRKRSYVSDSDSSGSDYLSKSEESDAVSDDAVEEEEEAPKQLKSRKKARAAVAPTRTIDSETSEDVHLFRALSHDGVAVTDLALDWVEKMEDAPENVSVEALAEMFNLILRCCGCVHLAQPHDLASYDSAAATVAEVGHFFKRQKSHEYPFVSKSKNTKHFRRNVSEFFVNIIDLSHEKGLLFKDTASSDDSSMSSPMINAILAWLFAFSSSEYRPFRYVSVCLLYSVQEQLCRLAASLTLTVEKQQRQLAGAQNGTSVRNRTANQRKIDLISNNIAISKRQREAILENLGDISQNVFNSRYRDIDSSIRVESLKALALWAAAYPDMFLQANYLRYFGWMLSDPVDQVKREALKALQKLYKNVSTKGEIMPISLRQFTESFKAQLLNMIWTDSAILGPMLIGVYIELTKLGFLNEEMEVRQICLYGFYLIETSALSPPLASLLHEYCNYVTTLCDIDAESNMEKYSHFLSTHESLFFGDGEDQLDVLTCLKFKHLAELFEASYKHYCKIERPKFTVDSIKLSLRTMLERLLNSMCAQPVFHGKWLQFLKYILLDVSLVQFSEKSETISGSDELEETELKDLLSLSTKDLRYSAMSIFSGMLLRILTSTAPKKAIGEKNIDELDVALPILVGFIPRIEKFLNSSESLYAVFLNIWNSLLVTLPTSIMKLFSLHTSIDMYNRIHANIMSYFIEMDSHDEEMKSSFETYFSIMSRSHDGRGSIDLATLAERLVTTDITIRFEDLVATLVAEVTDAILNEEIIISSAPEDVDDNDELSNEQLLLMSCLLKVLEALNKLAQIAKSTNINRFITEPILESPNSLMEIVQVKLLSKIDMSGMILRLPYTCARQAIGISESWKSLVHLLLLTFCWSLEDLTYASGDNTASIDINVFMADYTQVIPSLCKILVSIQNSMKQLNDSLSGNDQQIREYIGALMKLSSFFAADVCDLLIAVRTFYSRFKGADNFKNFEQFFESLSSLLSLVIDVLPGDLQAALFNIFLVKETSCATILEVTLERAAEEDVNIGDFVIDIQSHEKSMEEVQPSEDSEIVQESDIETAADRILAKATEKKWKSEKELCVYALKLILLEKTGALSPTVSERLRLNQRCFGSLYPEVLRLGTMPEVPASASNEDPTES